MGSQCHGQREFQFVELNSKPMRRIELCTKVSTDIQVWFGASTLCHINGLLQTSITQ